MTITKICNGIALMILLIATGINGVAQDADRVLLKQVIKENQDAVDAIAMYPTETRKLIFEATEYPEVIAKLNAMQKNSQEAFEKLVSPYGKEEQEKIWNLTRYDGLIADLAALHEYSEFEINNIVANYPEEIRNTAKEERKNNYELLDRIDKMNKNYNSDFEFLMSGYPPEAVTAFREMIKMPDVLSLLFDHMQYTVVVGDYYKKNPERVIYKTDSLNLVLTQKNAQEVEDWKQSMNENPKAQEEYTQAAQEYAQENGYQPQEYTVTLAPDVTNYTTYPYNWWFGYPSWYPYNYWNPYPYWYDWGYYYGPGGHVVFFGLPSAYFMDWYFYYPEHSYKYAELSNHYYNYYHRHRDSRNNNAISHSVHEWRNRNKDVVTDNWDKDNINRTQMFKEYGQMEMDRTTFNNKNPQQQVTQAEFIQNKQTIYPLISADVSNKQIIPNNSKPAPVHENITEPVRKPVVTVPDHYKITGNEPLNNKQPEQNNQPHNGAAQNNNNSKQPQPGYSKPQPNNNDYKQTQGSMNGNTGIQQKNPTPVKQTEEFNQIRNAEQYHQNAWQQIQKPTQPQSQQAQQPQRPQQPQQQKNTSPPPMKQENHKAEQPAKQNTQTPSNKRK